MNRLSHVAAVILAISAIANASSQAPSRAEELQPGTERWAVKIGADPDSASVRSIRNNPVGELARLIHLPRPASLPEDHRLALERGIYTVAATVSQFKLEKDGDYHVVLSDGGRTMIAEIPDPDFCTGSRWLPQIKSARSSFDARYHVTPRFRYVKAPALVTGVVFFDFNHRQAGVAPNAVELHPVLSITWSGSVSGRQPMLLSPRRHSHSATGEMLPTRRKSHRQSRGHRTAPGAANAHEIMVWVNTRTGVYHYPGTRWYQNTRDGKLIPESEAKSEGDRPAENGQ